MILASKYIGIASALLLVLLAVQDVSGSRDVIDNEPLADGSIVDQLCDHHMGQRMRISRISSISVLHRHFISLSNAKQAACRDFYLQPLADLKALLEVGSDNICSVELMNQIDSFHWRYVVGSLSKRWRKASEGSLPEPLRIFFMNYAQEVTEKCKDTLMRRLTLSAGNTDTLVESLNTNKLGLVINQLSAVLQPPGEIKKHDDFLLIWDQLADRERRKGHSIDHKIDLATRETVYGSFKVKNPEGAWMVQRKCRQELRPVYRQTVLPVMRLLSIGYGRAEKQSREDVAGSDLVKNWYAITQLCQLLLPLNFYQDKVLGDEQAAALSMDESSALPTPEESLVASSEIASVDVEPVHLNDDVLPGAADDQIVKLVKSNLKSRGHVFRQIIRNAFKGIGGVMKSKLKNLIISKKVGDKHILENGEPLSRQAEELLAGDDDAKAEEEGKTGALVREKRHSTAGILVFTFFMTIVIGLLVVLPMCLIIFVG